MRNLSRKFFNLLSFSAFVLMFSAVGSFAQEAPNAAPPVEDFAKIRVGVAVPKASFTEGADNLQMALSLREIIAGYFQGTEVEIVPLDARIPQALADEAEEKDCKFILQTVVTQKKGGGGFGMFKKIAPVVGSVVPMAGMAGGVTGAIATSVAQTALYTAADIAGNTKSKDQFTFEYSLTAAQGGAVKANNSLKAKAGSDGEDVLSPMIEKMAEAVLAAVK